MISSGTWGNKAGLNSVARVVPPRITYQTGAGDQPSSQRNARTQIKVETIYALLQPRPAKFRAMTSEEQREDAWKAIYRGVICSL